MKLTQMTKMIMNPTVIVGLGSAGCAMVHYCEARFKFMFGGMPRWVQTVFVESDSKAFTNPMAKRSTGTQIQLGLKDREASILYEKLNEKSPLYDKDFAGKYNKSVIYEALTAYKTGGGAANSSGVSLLMLEESWADQQVSSKLSGAAAMAKDNTRWDESRTALKKYGWDITVNEEDPILYIVSGTMGATSKIVIQLAYYLRQIAPDFKFQRGFFSIPDARTVRLKNAADMQRANVRAQLEELDYFMDDTSRFEFIYPDGVEISTVEPVFQQCLLCSASGKNIQLSTTDGWSDEDGLHAFMSTILFAYVLEIHEEMMTPWSNKVRFQYMQPA